MYQGQSHEEINEGEERIEAGVDLMYYGSSVLSVRGPVSGRLYQFSRQRPTQRVDARDAVSMLKTRHFRRLR